MGGKAKRVQKTDILRMKKREHEHSQPTGPAPMSGVRVLEQQVDGLKEMIRGAFAKARAEGREADVKSLSETLRGLKTRLERAREAEAKRQASGSAVLDRPAVLERVA